MGKKVSVVSSYRDGVPRSPRSRSLRSGVPPRGVPPRGVPPRGVPPRARGVPFFSPPLRCRVRSPAVAARPRALGRRGLTFAFADCRQRREVNREEGRMVCEYIYLSILKIRSRKEERERQRHNQDCIHLIIAFNSVKYSVIKNVPHHCCPRTCSRCRFQRWCCAAQGHVVQLPHRSRPRRCEHAVAPHRSIAQQRHRIHNSEPPRTNATRGREREKERRV